MGETERPTLREAAEVIGLPLDAPRKRVCRGTIPAEKIDGQYTISAGVVRSLAPPSSGSSSPATSGIRPPSGSAST